MKVKIVKCSHPRAWYNAAMQMFSEFEVYEKGDEYLFDEGDLTYHIDKSDCEVVEQ